MKTPNLNLVCIVGLLLVSISTAQIPDTLKIYGSITGDITENQNYGRTMTITVTPKPPARGGGVDNNVTNDYGFTNLSWYFYGTVTPSGYGYSFTPKDSILKSMTKSITGVNFKATDTMRPSLHILNLKDTTVLYGQSITIKTEVADNSRMLSAFYYEFSTDSGETWNKIGEEVKTTPDLFLTGYARPHNPIYLPHNYTFTPQVINKNYTLRVIVADYWHALKDTQSVSFKVLPSVGVTNTSKPIVLKPYQTNNTVDLKGRKVLTNKKAPNIFLNSSGLKKFSF